MEKIVETKPKLLVVLFNSDISYISSLGSIIGKSFSGIETLARKIELKSELLLECKRRRVSFVATTSLQLMQVVNPSLEGSVNDNVGTVLEINTREGDWPVRLILLPTLKTMYAVNHGRFLLGHYCSKLRKGGVLKKDPFTWEFLTPNNIDDCELQLENSAIAAVDIETGREDLRITSVAYTWLNKDYTTTTRVVQCDENTYPFCISAVRRMNKTRTPKVMQNGKYDSVYFLRFNAPLSNWIHDTYHLMHAIFPELPRTLAFTSSFYLDNFRFWKEEGKVNLYEYNGKDTHNTLWTYLAMIYFIQDGQYDYVVRNYLNLFPIIFPAISCALDGMEVDEEIRLKLVKEGKERKQKALERVNYLIDETEFNPSSPKQVKEMLKAFGYHSESSDENHLKKWKEKFPVYGRIADAILDYRGAVKAIGTYFEVSLLNQRLMYSLDPSGTETGRMASRESNFWCGTQIQNIPQYARVMCKAEEGWTFGAVDKAQSESYCTGYLSQEPALIRALLESSDFHCHNASMFFGIPFEDIYDEESGKVLLPKIRKLAKPVNHGANYNMGPDVLLGTMGTFNVMEAKRILQLPSGMGLIGVCTQLLQRFDRTYPRIRGEWYKEITLEILRTGKLHIAASGFTRRTFLQPTKSKLDLNAAVAHKPQSLSVHLVNKSFLKIWRELQIGKYSGRFRLKAQVHDENLFIAKDDIIDSVCEEVADMMTIPTKVEGRIMTIPSTIAKGKYWNEAHG